MAFTFKPAKPNHKIKLDKYEVGIIEDKTWRIRFMVIKDNDKFKDDNKNCTWMWVLLKKRPNSLQDAKDFLNRNFERIIEAYPLRKIN